MNNLARPELVALLGRTRDALSELELASEPSRLSGRLDLMEIANVVSRGESGKYTVANALVVIDGTDVFIEPDTGLNVLGDVQPSGAYRWIVVGDRPRITDDLSDALKWAEGVE